MKTMGLAFCALLLLAACNTDTFGAEDGGLDAPSDGTAGDGSKDGASSDGGTLEDANEDGPLDAGSDGPACPICEAGTTCCLIPTSANFGKCYASACLACCQ